MREEGGDMGVGAVLQGLSDNLSSASAVTKLTQEYGGFVNGIANQTQCDRTYNRLYNSQRYREKNCLL